MIKLYDHAVSGNCYKVRLALSQLGVAYERINVDIFKGEQNERWFAALNPNNLYSEDPKDFGAVTQWLFFGKTTIDPALARARFITRFVLKEIQKEKELEALREAGKSALQILNDHLKKHNFLAGSYSIADIGCYAYVHTAEEGEVSLSPFPAVLSWCDRIRSQPRYISMED